MSPKKQFKWSSHQPVVRGLLTLLRPQFILELGVGNYSTPLLLASNAQTIIHIENDRPWLDHVIQHFANDERSEFRFHDIGAGINKATPWSALGPDWQQSQIDYYTELTKDIPRDISPRLLFVDHYTCLRTLSINLLADWFDAVIYHDAETPEVYDYQMIRQDLADQFDHYQLRPQSSWTGFMVRKGIADAGQLHDIMREEFSAFAKGFGRSVDEFSMAQL